MDSSLETARRWFAEDLRIAAPVVRTEAIIDAFARIPREAFCGDGPWRIYPRRWKAEAVAAQDPRPSTLYHDVLIVIDEARGLNNGQPSLWAYIFDHLGLAPGQSVLQIGAGTGYYTAILADIVGPKGQVEAVELDPALATRAREALAPWPWVSVRQGDGAALASGPAADVVVVCAGATHPAKVWLERLSPGGRLMVPLTTAARWGFLLLVENTSAGFKAATLGPCGFFHCDGARRPDEERRLEKALAAMGEQSVPVRALHHGTPAPTEQHVWLAGDDYWLSSQALV
jgi:protein-L-isoaspartate(D-aspartate) O-methyltransferase